MGSDHWQQMGEINKADENNKFQIIIGDIIIAWADQRGHQGDKIVIN